MDFVFASPSDDDFKKICSYIRAYELDSRELKKEEFCVAFGKDRRLLGFGRLRQHPDCMELCSLGVVKPYRNKGIGKAIIAEIIKKAPGTIHLVCIIPEFFTAFGFQITTAYPSSIQLKLDYCIQSLPVPESYVAMHLQQTP